VIVGNLSIGVIAAYKLILFLKEAGERDTNSMLPNPHPDPGSSPGVSFPHQGVG
jgi:hypothetical protein